MRVPEDTRRGALIGDKDVPVVQAWGRPATPDPIGLCRVGGADPFAGRAGNRDDNVQGRQCAHRLREELSGYRPVEVHNICEDGVGDDQQVVEEGEGL